MSQINTYSPDGTSRTCVQADNGGGQVMVGVQNAAPGDGDPAFDELGGTWVPLDRAGCNNLIRAVRRMRDNAFGKDE